jgi:glycosyltransferase 2 family protein
MRLTNLFNKKPSYARLIRVVGLAVFAVVLSRLDWMRFLNALRSINGGPIAVYSLLFAAVSGCRSLRLQGILSRLSHDLRVSLCYKITTESTFFGTITPGRVGEFVKVGLLRETGFPMLDGFIVSLLERIFDTLAFLTFGLAGSLYLFRSAFSFREGILLSTVMVMVTVATIAGIWRANGMTLLTRIFTGLLKRFATGDGGEGIARTVWKIAKPTWKMMLSYSTLFLLLNMAQVYVLARALSIQVSPLYLCISYAASALVALLPVSISGLGTREVTYIFLLGKVGISAEVATLFSILDGLFFPIVILSILMLPTLFISLKIRPEPDLNA